MAAVLAAGPDAVLSHHSAGALWGIRPTSRTRIDITTPRTLHATPTLHPHCAVLRHDERTTHQGIPVTTPARTLLDLAAALDRRRLERAITEAERLHRTSPTTIQDLGHDHRGTTNLKTLLLNARSTTRSELRPSSSPSPTRMASRNPRRTSSSREPKSTPPGASTDSSSSSTATPTTAPETRSKRTGGETGS